ncbi:MAG TPA: hypothetical protein VFY74_00325, partial [Methyloceanibacter sp.]|nr:hypothetical protein [Methyloceanibacter sp.]
CPHSQVKQGDTCVDVTPPAAEPAPEPAPKKVPQEEKAAGDQEATRLSARILPQPESASLRTSQGRAATAAAMPVWHDPDRTALRAHPDPP